MAYFIIVQYRICTGSNSDRYAICRFKALSFEESLLNRTIQSYYYLDGELVISWGGTPANGPVRTDLTYINSSGAETTITVPLTDMQISIADWKWGTPFSYRTAFAAEETSSDVIYTAYTEITNRLNMIDRKDWVATTNSYETEGQRVNSNSGPAWMVLDGNPMTYWHSRHSGSGPRPGEPDPGQGSPPGYPYWLAFDMGEKINVEQVVLTSRNDGSEYQNDFYNFVIQASDNGTDWTDYGAYTHPDTRDPVLYSPNAPLTTRYIRVYMETGRTAHCHLAEFAVFGTPVE